MARTGKFLIVIALPALLGSTQLAQNAQNAAKKPIEGVWKMTEKVVTGDGAMSDSNPQPTLILFTRGHYSLMGVNAQKPRTLFKTMNPTNEEKVAAFDTFFANSGTYEISGTTLTIHPTVARFPNFMAGGFEKYQFRIEGNTLTLSDKSSDSSYNLGGKVVPDPSPMSEERLKFVRVE